MGYKTTDLKIIANELRWAKDKGYSTAVLLGSGMSLTAGIPLAIGIIKEIKKKFPNLAKTFDKETYQAYMSLLTPAQRKELIDSFIDNAKINIAHLYLGSLVKNNYVDRILTTNFDPLVIRSLTLYNIYPAIYDFADSQAFVSREAVQLSVFYLHGQRDRFVLLNTEEQANSHWEKLGNVFQDVSRGRIWIIIGYNGDCDPVFERLAEISNFKNKLFWIGYKDEEPKEHILEKILNPNKSSYYLKGYTADKFFFDLAKELDLPELQIISNPFSYLKEVINTMAKYPIDDKMVDITKETKKWIDLAINGFEDGKGFEDIKKAGKSKITDDKIIRKSRDIWVHGRFNQIDNFYEVVSSNEIKEAKEYLALALNNWGNERLNLAKNKEPKEAKKLFKQSIDKYEKAIKIKPDDHEALNNWGTALDNLARLKEPKEAEKLFKQSIAKYKRVLKIKPDYYKAFNNLGNAFSDLAMINDGKEAEEFFIQSFEKYESSLKIEPDNYIALHNWGIVLLELAKKKEREEAEELMKRSFENFIKSEKIIEGFSAYNLACMYSFVDEVEKSLFWLEKGLRLKSEPSRSHILTDSDLDNIKHAEEFNRLINKYRPE